MPGIFYQICLESLMVLFSPSCSPVCGFKKSRWLYNLYIKNIVFYMYFGKADVGGACVTMWIRFWSNKVWIVGSLIIRLGIGFISSRFVDVNIWFGSLISATERYIYYMPSKSIHRPNSSQCWKGGCCWWFHVSLKFNRVKRYKYRHVAWYLQILSCFGL
jgi:hypothetical protein